MAQVWAWRSGDTLVFDSIEANQAIFGGKNELLNTLFRGLADYIVEKTDAGIKRVLVGAGGRTPKNCAISLSKYSPISFGHHGHTDAVQQRQLSVTLNDLLTQLKISEKQSSEEISSFIDHITTLDQWLIFTYYLKIDHVEHPLWHKLLQKLDFMLLSQEQEEFYNDLSKLLAPLDPQLCKAVCESKNVQHKLSTMVKHISDFCDGLLRHLDSKSCRAVCDSKGVADLFPNLLKSTHGFLELIRIIEDTQLETVLESKPVRDQLQKILETVRSPKEITRLIVKNPIKAKLVIKIIQDKLITFIETAKDFYGIMASLEPAQQQEIYKLVQDKLPMLVETAEDFARIMVFLKPTQKQKLYSSVQAKLPTLIKTASDFGYIMPHLTNSKYREAIYHATQDKLLMMINDSTDFRIILVNFEPTQCKAICESKKIQKKIPRFIPTIHDFLKLVSSISFNTEKFKRILELDTIRQRFRSVINTPEDIRNIKKSINLEKLSLVFELILDKLPLWIQTKEDFWEVIRLLNSDQRQFVIKSIQDKLSTLIQKKEEFWELIRLTSPDLRESIFLSMKDSLSENIKADLIFELLNRFQFGRYHASEFNTEQFDLFLLNSLGSETMCSPSLMIEIVADLDSKSCNMSSKTLSETKKSGYSAGFFPVSCPQPPSTLTFILAIHGDNKDIVSQYCRYTAEKNMKIPEEIITFAKKQSGDNVAAQSLLEFELLQKDLSTAISTQDWKKVMHILLIIPNLASISSAHQEHLKKKQAVLAQEWMKWTDSQASDGDKLTLLYDLFTKENCLSCIVSLDVSSVVIPDDFFWRPRTTRSIGTEILYRYSPLLKQLAAKASDIEEIQVYAQQEIGLLDTPRDHNSLRKHILNAFSDQYNPSFRFLVDRAINPKDLAGYLDVLHDEFMESSEAKHQQQAEQAEQACFNLASYADIMFQRNLALVLGEKDFARVHENPTVLASVVTERKQSFRK